MRLLALPMVVLCACAAEPQVRELSNASINNLMAQPIPQFFAALRVANRLAQDCPNIAYDERVAQAITDARTRNDGGTYAAIQNNGPTEIESDILWRSINARYEGQDACAAGKGEIARQSSIGAVLVEL